MSEFEYGLLLVSQADQTTEPPMPPPNDPRRWRHGLLLASEAYTPSIPPEGLLVTIAQINGALRLDLQGTAPNFSADDRTPDIELKIRQAQDIILDFIQPKPSPPWTQATVPGRVSAAIVMAVGYLLDNSPEGQEAMAGLTGETVGKPGPLMGLLKRLRTPTLA